MLRALVIVLSIVLCLAVFDIIVLVGEILQALFYLTTSYNSQNETWLGNIIFPIKPTFIYINFIPFIIYDK